MFAGNDRAVVRLIEILYSCVEGSWSPFLDAVADHFGSSIVTIVSNAYVHAVTGVDPVEVDKYQKHYIKINPWRVGDPSYPVGKILLSQEYLPLSDYRRTAYYNEWGKKNHLTHGVGGAIRATSTISVFFGINRGDAQDQFAEEERAMCQVLMPHIQRAVHFHDRLHALEQAAWTLDAVAFPMIYATAEGAVRWMNRAAEKLLRSGRGLRVSGGRLQAELAEEDAALRKMLRQGRSLTPQSVTGYGGWLRITRADNGSEMTLFLTQAPGRIKRVTVGGNDGGSGFLIFVAIQSIDANMLMNRVRKTWALTMAEATLCVEILENEGLQEAAAKLRISRNTAKSQLASIFLKSGARRQSELVRKLLALAAIAPADSEGSGDQVSVYL